MIEILIAVIALVGAGAAGMAEAPPTQAEAPQFSPTALRGEDVPASLAVEAVAPADRGETSPHEVDIATPEKPPMPREKDPKKSTARLGSGSLGVDRKIPVILDTPVITELPGRAIFTVTEDMTASDDSEVLVIPAGSRAVGLYVPLKMMNAKRLDICIDTIASPVGRPLARLRGSRNTSHLTCLAQVHSEGGAGLAGTLTDRGPLDSPVMTLTAGTPGFLVLWDDIKVEQP